MWAATGEGLMAMEDFVRQTATEWNALSVIERVARVRKLSANPNTREFIRTHFPEVYAEAFPPAGRGAGGRSVSETPHELCAEPRSDRGR